MHVSTSIVNFLLKHYIDCVHSHWDEECVMVTCIGFLLWVFPHPQNTVRVCSNETQLCTGLVLCVQTCCWYIVLQLVVADSASHFFIVSCVEQLLLKTLRYYRDFFISSIKDDG